MKIQTHIHVGWPEEMFIFGLTFPLINLNVGYEKRACLCYLSTILLLCVCVYNMNMLSGVPNRSITEAMLVDHALGQWFSAEYLQ